MFPRLRQRIGIAALDRLDVLIELSTLGEYGLGEDGRPLPLANADRDPAPPSEPGDAPATLLARPLRLRDECPLGGRPTSQRCDAPAAP